jgi:hypothetical protein
MEREIDTNPYHLIEKFQPVFIPFNDLDDRNSNFLWFGESKPVFFDGVYGVLISVNAFTKVDIRFYHGVFKNGIFKGLLNLECLRQK